MIRHAVPKIALLCAACWCISRPAAAEEPRLTLGPAIVTLPEIAAALSVGGRRVDAGADLKDAAAFIRIKDRVWSEVRDLLCGGLDLVLKERKGGRDSWTLSRDPVVRDREQSWRRRLARNMRSFMLVPMPAALKLAVQSPEQLKARADEMKRELDGLEAQGKKDSLRYRTLEPEYDRVHSATFWGPQQRLYAAWMAADSVSAATMESAVESGVVSWVFRPSRLPAELLASVGEKVAHDGQPVSFEHAMGVVTFVPKVDWFFAYINLYLLSKENGLVSVLHPNVGSMTVPASFVADISQLPDRLTGIDCLFHGRRTVDGRTFNGLGDEAEGWLQQQRARTASFLKSDRANTAIPTPARFPDSLSQWIEAWSNKVGGEAVMELCPGGEAYGGDGSEPQKAAYSLAELCSGPFSGSFGAWTLDESNGVLLVKNQLAFLYRARPRPVAPLVRLLSRIGPAPAPANNADTSSNDRLQAASLDGLPFPIIRDYVRDVSTIPHAYWTYPSTYSDQYRGYSLGYLDNLVPLVYVWDRLSPADRKQLVETASSKLRKSSLSVSTLGLSDLRQFGRLVQAWDAAIHTDIARDPTELARSETLFLNATLVPGQPRTYRLLLSVVPGYSNSHGEIIWTLP